MTQAQQTHPSTIRSIIPLAVASLLVSALVGVAVVLTQVAPLRIDTTDSARSYAVNTAETWEAQRDAISAATYEEASSYRPGVLRRQAAANSADELTRGSSRAPIAR